MSTASQFSGAGLARPAGTLNGTASLAVLSMEASAQPITSGRINAKCVLPGALSAGVLATVLNLSGKGVLSFLACSPVDTTARTHRFKVTLDGVVVFDATSGSTSAVNQFCTVIGSVVPAYSTLGIFQVIPEQMFFNTSLLIEYASSVSETDKTNIGYKYYAR